MGGPVHPSDRDGDTSGTLTMSLRGVTVNKVLKILGEKTGKNFIADPSIENRKINVELKDVPIDEAMAVIMETNGLGYRRKEGTNIYIVDSIERIMMQTVITSVKLQYAEAEKLKTIIESIVTPGIGSAIADARTNILIIRDNPGRIEELKVLIKQMDRPTYQVYIKAAIVEISTSNDSETGMEWIARDLKFREYQGRATTDFSLRSGGIDNSGTISIPPLPIGQGFGIGIINTNIDAVLHALSESHKINLLSRPYLVTLDNQEATIEVGDQIPYRILNQYGITSTEFKNATILLKVKPHINNNKTITLKVEPHADFLNGVTPDGTPIIGTRKASTNIIITDGNTIMIGGLMRNSENISESKVPILGSIPILGYFFKSSVKNSVKTELIVFITPKIISETGGELPQEEKLKIKEKLEEKLDF